ncbi:hypothetical protein PoB_000859500 [Plakobranchus ocellatus]|uniref:Uncharacterized protein n=1 Tax=Plakobranchus ocellatus TaxID=259542 RepID=A0AAV3YHT5_9GAST|nr:hypothetical protein PoB_000859500 [Plakobranchus ocellatus]
MFALKSFYGFQQRLPYGLAEMYRHSQLCSEEWLVLSRTSDRSCCWLLVSSAVYAMGVSRTVTFDMTTLAASNAYSSRFLTPALAMAIALALIAAHRERNVRSDIESQVPRTNSTWRLRAIKGQDDGASLNFVLNSAPPPSPPPSNIVDHDCELLPWNCSGSYED